MTIKIVTSWICLIQKAKKVGEYRLSGDPRLADAEADLRAYEELVKQSDSMILPVTRGQI